MTKTLSMISSRNYNLNANESFVIFLTSKLITSFIGGVALTMKPQSIAHFLNESEHIYWNLDLEGAVHSIWDSWVSGLQECKSNEFFFKIGWAGNNFQLVPQNCDFFGRAAALARFWHSEKFVRGSLTSSGWNQSMTNHVGPHLYIAEEANRSCMDIPSSKTASNVQDWSLQWPSNEIWRLKIYLSQNIPSKCNPKLKLKSFI